MNWDYDWVETLVMGVGGFLFLLIIVVGIGSVIQEIKNPCIEYGKPEQVWYQPPPIITNNQAIFLPGYYIEEKPCVKRKKDI